MDDYVNRKQRNNAKREREEDIAIAIVQSKSVAKNENLAGNLFRRKNILRQQKAKIDDDDELDAPRRSQGDLARPVAEKQTHEVCIVCQKAITFSQAIWNCRYCWTHSIHLACIQSWIARPAKSLDEDGNQCWNCPSCKRLYPLAEYPRKYFCYCGQVENPNPSRWLQSHACENLCNRRLLPLCGHQCTQPCHAGACSPCSSMKSSPCYCGKESKMKLCAEKHWSCLDTCSRRYATCKHACVDPCHEGACRPCSFQDEFACRCKKVKKQTICSESTFSCEQKCGILLSCGHHHCEKVCHDASEPCSVCPGSQPRYCFCGKSEIKKPCYEEVAESCGLTCDKKLNSCDHKCVFRCHKGACSKCTETSIKTCKCGQVKNKRVVCSSDVFSCSFKCSKPINCGKHTCNRKCCTGCRVCERVCDTHLNCKLHKCTEVCHRGACQICPKMITLSCPCFRVQEVVPCGTPRRVLSHLVSASCPGLHVTKSVECNQTTIQCYRECGNLLECGNHTCISPCHRVNVMRELQDGRILETIADELEEMDATECDNCSICELPCDKPRLCKHKCQLGCHLGSCERCEIQVKRKCYCESVTMYVSCWELFVPELMAIILSCKMNCWRKRPKCGHRCGQICHTGECRSGDCFDITKVTCKCGHLKEDWDCFRVQSHESNANVLKFDDLNLRVVDCTTSCTFRRAELARKEHERLEAEKQKQIDLELAQQLANQSEAPRKKGRNKHAETDLSLNAQAVDAKGWNWPALPAFITSFSCKKVKFTKRTLVNWLCLFAFLALVGLLIYIKLTD